MVKLHHISGNIPDTCTKCLNQNCLNNCLWECPKIQTFWKDVRNYLSEVFHINIPLKAKFCVLGIKGYPLNYIQKQKQAELLDFGFL